MGMVAGTHCRTPYRWSPAKPAIASSLAQLNILMVNIAYLADSGQAITVDAPHFAGWQPDKGIFALLGH
jgi:hypothetical protein